MHQQYEFVPAQRLLCHVAIIVYWPSRKTHQQHLVHPVAHKEISGRNRVQNRHARRIQESDSKYKK